MQIDSSIDSLHQCRIDLRQRLEDCRAITLARLDTLDYNTFCHQAHADFSPVGWHLGHIAYTEALWILQRCAGFPPQFREYHRLFAADGLPKSDRVHLPDLNTVRHYLDTIRTQVLEYLEIAPLDQQERIWRWLIQHESQHNETMTLILALQHFNAVLPGAWVPEPVQPDMVAVPAGPWEIGLATLEALDNERGIHTVNLESYWIDRYPVTCGEYQRFIAAGGYTEPRWWSEAGWQWLQANPVQQPLYWTGDRTQINHPVCGVSWYEADAYARFVGKRLPTEAEWEKAAAWDPNPGVRRRYPWGDREPTPDHCNHYPQQPFTTPVNAYPVGVSALGCYDLLGNVWEWTASWFAPYPGFTAYPYPGYSQAYFDGQHRVLRGGSWATCTWAMRNSFRNWYHPGTRQIFAGFRCVSSYPQIKRPGSAE